MSSLKSEVVEILGRRGSMRVGVLIDCIHNQDRNLLSPTVVFPDPIHLILQNEH